MATKFRHKISQNCTKFPAQIASFVVETWLKRRVSVNICAHLGFA